MEAHKEQKREEHLALQEVKIDSDVWLAMMWNHSYEVSANVVQHLNMKRVPIVQGMQELADKPPLTERTPLGRVLEQGRCYARFRVLRSYKLLNLDDAKKYLISCRMPKGAVAELKNVDMRQIALTFGEE